MIVFIDLIDVLHRFKQASERDFFFSYAVFAKKQPKLCGS